MFQLNRVTDAEAPHGDRDGENTVARAKTV